jgi:hypothetical protein
MPHPYNGKIRRLQKLPYLEKGGVVTLENRGSLADRCIDSQLKLFDAAVIDALRKNSSWSKLHYELFLKSFSVQPTTPTLVFRPYISQTKIITRANFCPNMPGNVFYLTKSTKWIEVLLPAER